MTLATLKTCTSCRGEFPADREHFRGNPRCRDGLSPWCCECHRQAVRRWRARKAVA